MRSRLRLAGGIALLAVASLASALARPDLPAEVAIHFDASGTPDDYASRTVALALLPGTMLALLALFEVLPRVDPLRENLASFERVYDVLALSSLAALASVHGLLLAFNLGYAVPMGAAVAAAVGGLFVAVGAVLDRVERNWVVGVRTPWTLSDDVVWERTHDRAAPAFVLAGIATVAVAVALPAYAIYAVVLAALVVAGYATAYSYVCYERRRDDGDATAP